jgi:hypothetical protein
LLRGKVGGEKREMAEQLDQVVELAERGGNCVEIADGFPGLVPVRDSKSPEGPTLILPAAAWAPFIASLRSA